jgi:hypothetical protein
VSWGPLKLRTASKEVIFDGEASPAPGGGSTPVQATYEGQAVTIADGATANLTWDRLDSGADLLERTDPANPTFLAAGFYAVSVSVAVAAILTAGGIASAVLSGSPASNGGFNQFGSCPAEATRLGVGCMALVTVQHYDAGDSPSVGVTNSDGAAARDYQLQSAQVVKLG